jgi:SAM-dependent methyltransferase
VAQVAAGPCRFPRRSAAGLGRIVRVGATRAEALEEKLRTLVPSSPKRPMGQPQPWFDYYAGYADAFVTDVIAVLADHATTVLDPWNGAGTTTAAAAKVGVRAVGLDINPATVVIAKARLLGSGVAASLTPLAEEVIEHARKPTEPVDESDLLARWLTPRSAAHVRGVERSITQLLVSAHDEGALTRQDDVNELSSLAALFLLALFRTAREILEPFQPTNPTWIRLRVTPQERLHVPLQVVIRKFRAQVTLLGAAVKANQHPPSFRPSEVRLADSAEMPLRRGSIGAVLTSPPYCTRIDYAIATLPELAVMGYQWDYVQALRAALIGTPIMLGEAHEERSYACGKLRNFLRRVERHDSYAARSYYYPFFQQYFDGMHASLTEINRVTRPGAPVVLVVQDSWFKDVHLDTSGILTAMAEGLGWRLTGEHRFVVRTRAVAHPHRATRRSSRATETVTLLAR